MIRRTSLLVSTVAILASVSAHASTSCEPYLDEEGRWKRDTLTTLVSEPGESVEDFVLRNVAPFMDSWTAENKVEACGIIASDGTRFSVRVSTDHVQHGCNTWSDFEEGFSSTGRYIHSHPPITRIYLTARDKAWSDHHGRSLSATRYHPSIPTNFSPEDFKAGPGWLVANGTVKYQEGPENITSYRIPIR